ncbi:Putative lipoprotein precursor [Fulvivirga imtechensis AK7]|uniref:Putative lipoprotein n=1 Tax=Fulvivirga imtechensis AK7 TaxID=1237149 RepID=L8JWH0_9BACT|nr:hypothetical protein [Fulvivirga imtechensis]ELR73391.1 Putative lipoprotein precursor [Fulvivirga imtechensis AK7]
MQGSKILSYGNFAVLIAGSLLFTLGCKPTYLSEEGLKSYVLDPDNELTKEISYKDYSVKVTFRPADLLIAQETGGETEVEKEELERLRQKYSDHYYFILSLSRDNKEAHYQTGQGFGQFSELVQRLSFRMHEYVNLTTSAQDTIHVGDYIFPRTYGMGGATNLMFAFNREKSIGKEWLQLNLKEFGLGVGNQNFRFRIEDIETVPKINFKEK